MIKHIKGDLFKVAEDIGVSTIVVGAHCIGEWNYGLKNQINTLFPESVNNIKKNLKRKAILGQVFSYPAYHSNTQHYYGIYFLINQENLSDPINLDQFCRSLSALDSLLSQNGISRCILPWIGCGRGGLVWQDVSVLFKRYFELSPITYYIVERDFE